MIQNVFIQRNENHKALSFQEVLRFAPSAGSTTSHQAVSRKYQRYSTINLIEKMQEDGWYPTYAAQRKVRLEANKGFQRHVIRLSHPDLDLNKQEIIQAIITNSHDGRSAYVVMLGIFRMVCSNGLIVGTAFEGIHIRHMHFQPEEVMFASRKVIEAAPAVAREVTEFKNLSITDSEKNIYAKSALALVYEDPEKAPVQAEQILTPQRGEDIGNSLWTTLNVVQENLIRGGLKGQNQQGRRITTRGVKSIDRDLKLNRALWVLAEEMKKIKEGGR